MQLNVNESEITYILNLADIQQNGMIEYKVNIYVIIIAVIIIIIGVHPLRHGDHFRLALEVLS